MIEAARVWRHTRKHAVGVEDEVVVAGNGEDAARCGCSPPCASATGSAVPVCSQAPSPSANRRVDVLHGDERRRHVSGQALEHGRQRHRSAGRRAEHHEWTARPGRTSRERSPAEVALRRGAPAVTREAGEDEPAELPSPAYRARGDSVTCLMVATRPSTPRIRPSSPMPGRGAMCTGPADSASNTPPGRVSHRRRGGSRPPALASPPSSCGPARQAHRQRRRHRQSASRAG